MNNKFRNSIMLVFLLVSLIALNSCYNDKAELLYPQTAVACDTSSVSYSLTVSPIALSNCAKSGCHDNRTKQNGYDMTTYEGMKSAANDPKFKGDLLGTAGYMPMPNDGTKLSPCEVEQLIAWANQGTQNN